MPGAANATMQAQSAAQARQRTLPLNNMNAHSKDSIGAA
jgi:hypothetical protein